MRPARLLPNRFTDLSQRRLVAPSGRQHLRLIVVFLRRGKAVMAEDTGGDADVVGVLDCDGGGGTVSEQMRRDGFAEGLAGPVLNVIADHGLRHWGAEPRNPKPVRNCAAKQGQAVIRTVVVDMGRQHQRERDFDVLASFGLLCLEAQPVDIVDANQMAADLYAREVLNLLRRKQ